MISPSTYNCNIKFSQQHFKCYCENFMLLILIFRMCKYKKHPKQTTLKLYVSGDILLYFVMPAHYPQGNRRSNVCHDGS